MKVRIKRSSEWIRARSIERGENVPDTVELVVDCHSLTQEARELLYTRKDPRNCRIDYFPETATGFSENVGYSLMSEDFQHDGDTATLDELSAEIVDAAKRLDARITERAAEVAEREAEEAKKAEEREAAKQARKAATSAALCELLAPELAKLTKVKAELDILSNAIQSVPLDCLKDCFPESERKMIEDAATCWIFSNRDDDE